MGNGIRERGWIPLLFLAPALIGLIVFRLAPIGIAIVGGFLQQTLRGETVFAGLANYLDLATDPVFWNSVRVTLLFNVLINPFQVVVALGLALLVFRPGPGVTFFRAAYFLPMCVSLAIVSVLWNILLDTQLGPVNGLLSALGLERQPFFRSESQALLTMIGIASWKGCGYWMMFLLAGLYAIPDDFHEAARIDGANAWQRFRYVTLPLMRRPILFVLIADTAINFLFFAPIYIITNGGPAGATDLLMFQAYQSAFAYLNHGRSLAISTILLVVIALFAVVEFRLFRSPSDA
ncbi:MAG: sugar ABC transporter permease [Geminicoccaceae bacterium]|jgi:multiple sugar transport system permease protein|nr:sugar ABC transporter permease [Geminicoccaceae bacterium]